MSLRLRALNAWLRLVEKPWLARVSDVAEARRRFEAVAERAFVHPPGARYAPMRLGRLAALEASAGRIRRRAILLWFHGGAFVQGSPATHRQMAAALAQRAGCRVILPDYRLAPEHPFPAAPDDALAAWDALEAAGYGAAEIALGGDSAGGNLAFGLLARLNALGRPLPAALLAFSPWVDLTLSADSIRRNAWSDPLLPAGRMPEIRDMVLAGADPAAPLASPVRAAFTAPPPVLIQASRSELLADDAAAMAARLRDAGGSVQLQLWKSTPHVWQIFQGRLPEADGALDAAGAFLRRHLAKAPDPAEMAPV